VQQTIELAYKPRLQFVPFHKRTQRWACIVAHRRAGKTVACINDLQDAALRCERTRPRFAYVAPFLKQAKQTAWDYLKDAASPLRRLGATVNESELRVDYPNGGQVRLYGADNPDALRGIYLDGVIPDEYADMDPRVWPEILRPALSDRKGWAAFIGTPKGRNSFYELHRESLTNPDWFSTVLKSSETGLIAETELQDARRQMSEDQFNQEYECSFDAAIVGAYYGKLMREAEEAKPSRITTVPYDPACAVWTAWDLGIRDATAIWFSQIVGREVHVIDYYEASGADLGHYVREIKNRPYTYGGHILPHDAQAKELGTGKTRQEVLESLQLGSIQIATMHRVEDGINAVRVMLPRCWFDQAKCARGIDALKLYRSEYDDKLKTFKPHPVHDWTSHAADAFRYLAMTIDRTADTAGFGKAINYPNQGYY
jgi:phage terminase large subunit